MTNVHFRNLFIATLLFTAQGLAHADAAFDAAKVIQHRLAMTNPTTVFDKWQADQWTFAAAHCGNAAGFKKELSAIEKLPLYLNGSWALPDDSAQFCATLAASGPSAECFNMSATQPPFTMPTAGLPSNYLFLNNVASAKDGSMHVVGGYCNLVKNSQHTRQFFAGKGTLTWFAVPRFQTFQTANGPRTLNAGTISFSVAGMPRQTTPQTVIVGSP